MAATIVLLILSLPYGTFAAFSPKLSTGGYSYQSVVSYIPIYVGLFAFALPLTPTFGVLFLSLTAIYIVFLAVAAMQGGGALKALKSSTREGMGAMLRNPLTATIMILGAALLATVILDTLQTSVGVQAGGLSGDPLQLLMSFTLAPLIEEVGFRFFLIGVPLLVVLVIVGFRGNVLLKALWRPSAAWDGVTPEDPHAFAVAPLKLLVYLLIVVSSIVFGLAHYLSGSGWEIGKISEAALDGVALAYLYVRYGLHASIIFHWVVDYASNAFAFYGQAAYGIPWTANSAYSLLPALDIIILVGLPALLYFAILLLRRLVAPRRPEPPEPGAAPPAFPT